ncbi:MAG TPA: glycoside hydrolase family 30 beta sandwich domain-containing protein, partial [Polyangiaceae bacterium]
GTAGATSAAGGAGGAISPGGSGGAGTGGGGGSAITGVHVRIDKTLQTIQGFGINSTFMPASEYLPIDNLFGTEGVNAIGLSILRVGMTSSGTLNGQGIPEAKAKGAKIIGTVMSPPAACKTNNSTAQGGHLISDDGGYCYEQWSDRIADFAEEQGLYAMSIGNQTDFASCAAEGPPCTSDFDSTVFTAKELVSWVKVAGPKLTAAGVKVIAPEPAEWIHAWSNASATGSLIAEHPHSSDPLGCGCFSNTPTDEGCAPTCLEGNGYDYGHWLWKDQEAWGAFDIFGVQQYHSQIAYAWPSDVNGGVRDKEVWQTEMSGIRHWPEEGPSIDIENGVAVAGWIHSALTVGEASAWVWFFYESYFENDNEGLAVTQETATIAKRYYTLGNYSKFVRPGYVAVAVAGNENENVLLSAFKGDDGTLVVVAVNKGDSTAEFPITIAGGTAPASMTPAVTSASENLVTHGAIPVTDGLFTASLPAMTVTSFVGK